MGLFNETYGRIEENELFYNLESERNGQMWEAIV